jgi:ESAT-6 family protein
MSPAPEMGQAQGALSSAAMRLQETRCDLDRLGARMVDHLASAQRVWGGQGSAAFQALGLAWSERQRTIVSALDRFEESLRATERDNTQTDESQSSAFARTQRRLG